MFGIPERLPSGFRPLGRFQGDANKRTFGISRGNLVTVTRTDNSHIFRSIDGLELIIRDAGTYEARNAAGLEVFGRLGGADFFDRVVVTRRTLGRYTGMLNDRVNGNLRWRDITKVTDVHGDKQNCLAVLTLTGERREGSQAFALTHRITFLGDQPGFLCELVEVKNLGTEPIDVHAFYFREYTPFATEKYDKKIPKSVPNLWKTPLCDAWFASDGAYFGGFTQAPTSTMFLYHLMDNGRSQHPDAMFVPEHPLVLKPDETYTPSEGAVWMFAICGMASTAGAVPLIV